MHVLCRMSLEYTTCPCLELAPPPPPSLYPPPTNDEQSMKFTVSSVRVPLYCQWKKHACIRLRRRLAWINVLGNQRP